MSDYPSLSSVQSQTDLDSLPCSEYTPPYCSTMSSNNRSSLPSEYDSLPDFDAPPVPPQSREPDKQPCSALAHGRAAAPLSSYNGMPLRCPRCPEEFMTRRFLNLHVLHIHDRAPVHHCPHCRGPYATTKDLNEHILRDHRAEPRPFKCDKCPCSYSSKLSLRLHLAETHTRVVRSCEECGYETRFDGAFRRHMKEKHSVSIEPDLGENGYIAKEARTIGFIPT